MVSYVTVSGGGDKTAVIGFDSKSNFALAEQLAAQINAGIAAGTIDVETDSGGSPPTIPAGVSGALIQSQSGMVILPYNYPIDLVTKPGPAVVLSSGAPNEIILSDSSTDLTFIANSGSGTVVAGGGDSRVSVGGFGNWSLSTGSGSDIIQAIGNVSATIAAGGGHNAILLGNGTDVVTSTGNDTIVGGSGVEIVNATGAQSDFVRGENSDLLFIGGSGGATILGGTGSDTYFGSARPTGKQVIVGGSSGSNYLFAGNGAATLVGGGNNDQLYAYGTEGQLLVAGSGNETLSAAFSSGADILRAGSGHDQLIGGTGADTFVGGSGHATIAAGSGPQVFEFINHHSGGTELVQGIFDPASIKIDLVGYGAGAVDQAIASQTMSNGSVTIKLTDGTKVTYQDVSSIDRSNFV